MSHNALDLRALGPREDPPAQDAAPQRQETAPPPHDEESWFKRHRKALLWVVAVIFFGGAAGAAGWFFAKPAPDPVVAQQTPTPTPTPTPAPATKASPLTGVQVAPALADKPIVSVIVENHAQARPQSGLQSAGVVYETLAEGGITRFQTFFLEDKPAVIGPVRSLRPYFVSWGVEFGSPVLHAGGSSEALNMVGSAGLKGLNALSIASAATYRATDRRAPHNLYTSAAKLDPILARYNFTAPATFTPSPRKPDSPPAAPKHPNIHIEYSYNGFQVDYTYDKATNSYARKLAGAPHVDRNTGKQIMVKNVVIEMTSMAVQDSVGHMRITTVGSGQGWVLRDGEAIPVTWQKGAHNARTKLIGADGKEVALNAGNTWYSVVPIGKKVTF